MESKVVVILGATCSGKTALSLKLAKILNTEIISADSRQVYKFLDIGTAKPTKDELSRVKHHFIDTLKPEEKFNVSIFEQESLKIIGELHKQNKIPIVCGGSGLYIKALIEGITETVIHNEDVRANLIEEYDKYGREYLYEKLKQADPVSAGKMLPQNWKRVIRALEVYYSTGKFIWQHHEEYKRELNMEFIQIGISLPREILYERINKRVDEMMDNGLLEEVQNLKQMGYTQFVNALNTVGYKEFFEYLEGKHTLDKAIELIKRNTRHYAKKQLTWFRSVPNINWIEPV